MSDINQVTLDASFSVCLGSNNTWYTGSNGMTAGNWLTIIYRSGIDFDISSIPSNAHITKVSLSIYIGDDYSSQGNDVGKMSDTAFNYHDGDDKSGFWSDVDGNEYLSNSLAYDGNNRRTAELNATARSDLQNQLNDGSFSVGWTQTSDPFNQGRDAQQYNASNPPQLIVEYTLPNAIFFGCNF